MVYEINSGCNGSPIWGQLARVKLELIFCIFVVDGLIENKYIIFRSNEYRLKFCFDEYLKIILV